MTNHTETTVTQSSTIDANSTTSVAMATVIQGSTKDAGRVTFGGGAMRVRTSQNAEISAKLF